MVEALGYTDAFGALKKHVPDEDKQNCHFGSFNSPRGMVDLVDEDKKLKRTLYVSGQNREVRFLSKE